MNAPSHVAERRPAVDKIRNLFAVLASVGASLPW
jgi:hypothetical protein